VSLLDEKIATQRETIKSSKSMLAQMDQQVNDIMTKGDSEKSVERSVTIRKQQAKERASLQKDIEVANKEIQKLNEIRAPIASELRKVEAEVGPIKYIAALIYGDNADANMLEAAVRWVIILLVAVFDPLAIALVLAANQSKEWDKEEPVYEADDGPINEEALNTLREQSKEELPRGELITKSELFPDVDEGNKLIDEIEKEAPEVILPKEPFKFVDHGEHPKDYDETQVEEPVVEVKEEKSIFEQHPYLLAGFDHFKDTTPIVYTPPTPNVELEPVKFKKSAPAVKKNKKKVELTIEPAEQPSDIITPQHDIVTDGVTEMYEKPYKDVGGGYVNYGDKSIKLEALKELKPELFVIRADDVLNSDVGFGTAFPKIAKKGDVFTRVDILPNRVFKFAGNRWIEVNKEQSDTYLDRKYIQYLVSKLDIGEYDVELLSESEKEQIKEYLNNNKSE
jgi:hypothetical protein